MTREYTNKLLEAIAGGVISPAKVVEMCMHCMSEYDVKDMCEDNDLLELLGFEEPDEPDVDETTEWHDFDPDC